MGSKLDLALLERVTTDNDIYSMALESYLAARNRRYNLERA